MPDLRYVILTIAFFSHEASIKESAKVQKKIETKKGLRKKHILQVNYQLQIMNYELFL
jgi:hypothetical protein